MNKEITDDIDAQNNSESTTSWLASLSEEIRHTPSIIKFKDVGSLASSYLKAEKALKQRVAVPKDDAPSGE